MTMFSSRKRTRRRVDAGADIVNAGVVFADFVEKELRAERERRAHVDGRGEAVLRSSGTLVTLLVAVGTLAAGAGDVELDRFSLLCAIGALLAFVVAGVLGLLANRLRRYEVVDPSHLHQWRDKDGAWNDTADKARRVIARANIYTIESLRKGNNTKASLVESAMIAQLVAFILLAAGLGWFAIGSL